MSGDGRLARPTFTISNTSRTFAGLINEFDGLVGATVKRRRTKAEYLDDGADPQPTAQFPTESYTVNRLVDYNKVFIKWELVAPIDREDKKLPGRQCWKDFCPFVYRIYVDGDFNYDNVIECPYTTATYFDRDGDPTVNPDEDVCGKRLADCRLRYPAGTTVPFGGFPGMSEIRAR